MSKIKRAADELWLPTHVRRKPSWPPTGRKFISRRCCCDLRECPTQNECFLGKDCSAGTTDYVVTISAAADDECDECDPDFNAAHTIVQFLTSCAWRTSIDISACLGTGGSALIEVIIGCEASTTRCFVLCQVSIREHSTPNVVVGSRIQRALWRKLFTVPGGPTDGDTYTLDFESDDLECWADDGGGGFILQPCTGGESKFCDFTSATCQVDFNVP